jgi:hypothetical protein
MLRIRFRHGICVGEAYVSVLLAIEGEVDHEADEHVPKMGKLGVGPGEQAPERPGHDGADGRAHRGDPACA